MNKHIIWATTIITVILILCGTLVYINHNSWTLRFEMDDNTLIQQAQGLGLTPPRKKDK